MNSATTLMTSHNTKGKGVTTKGLAWSDGQAFDPTGETNWWDWKKDQKPTDKTPEQVCTFVDTIDAYKWGVYGALPSLATNLL
jgi:hypothetical protein